MTMTHMSTLVPLVMVSLALRFAESLMGRRCDAHRRMRIAKRSSAWQPRPGPRFGPPITVSKRFWMCAFTALANKKTFSSTIVSIDRHEIRSGTS